MRLVKASRAVAVLSTEENLQNAILRAVHEIMSETVITDVRRALEAGDAQAALDAIRFDLGEAEMERLIPRAIRDAYEAGGEAAAAELRTHFQLINPEALAYVRQRAADLISDFGASSKEAIVNLIHESIGGEMTPSELANEIVETGIGLNERQTQAQTNYRDALEADENLTARQVEQRAEAYYERQLEYRSRMIARTEVIAAETRGNQELWRQAGERGLVDRGRAVQEWRFADEDACPICEELDETTAPIGGSFHGGFTGPPAHPNCRCLVVLLPFGQGAE